ncbi:DOA4-independent degradation protein 4 [Neolecta irregularis DAH-3]|uniref:DOA4-independent degradation protein 4 n=1 Tax=Neolecta irregularis (strain DAH-3) TaxID=1198029 RepID=A0A1U7LHA1_NEOID|nr:DOA4-independent degradation protein 4 [Neolecta irregularis DAH-3]|eukprot:OLL22024.1 DOA4-independent degradation protein 4 [Neolecta irregularis DAH-3]
MNFIDWAFGRKTLQERLRANQRSLDRAIRELDRERNKLESQEKKLIGDIKKTAKANQLGACKIMAKDLVRTRRYIQKFYGIRTQLQGVALRIQTVRSNEQMMTSMKGATRLLGGMNKSMNLPALQKIAMEFERENDLMDQRQEMMDDGTDDEDESEEVITQVLDEIGISFGQSLKETPTGLAISGGQKVGVAEAAGAGNEDDYLQARLDSLGR